MNEQIDIAPDERKVLDWLAGQSEAMRALLEELVNIDSGTYNKAGVDRAGAAIRRFLDSHGIVCDVIPNDRFGDCLRATVGARGERNILLMGHRDTVFPEGEAARRPFSVKDGHGFGPGVADMKAGVVMNCFVAAAFKKFGGRLRRWSCWSRPTRRSARRPRAISSTAEARRARFVLNGEPGRVPNAIVTGRKAGVFMRFTVTGKAAHAGANFEQGASAIGEMAHKIIALHALTDLAKGITVNVGVIKGGQTVNTVAPSASGEIDLRYVDPEDRDRVLAAIETIMAHSSVAGTSAVLEPYAEFLALVPSIDSQRLFEIYAACGHALGQTLLACSPAAAPMPAFPRRPARRPSARWGRSAAAPTAPTNSSSSHRW